METYVIQAKTLKNPLLTAIFVCFTIQKIMKEEVSTADHLLECVKLFLGRKNATLKVFGEISSQTDDYFNCPNKNVPDILEEKIQKDLKSMVIDFIKSNKEKYISLISPYPVENKVSEEELNLKNIEFENSQTYVNPLYLFALSEITGVHINIFEDFLCEKLSEQYKASEEVKEIVNIIRDSGNYFYVINRNAVHETFHKTFYDCSEEREQKKNKKLVLASEGDYHKMLFFSFLKDKTTILYNLLKDFSSQEPESLNTELMKSYKKTPPTFFRDADEWKRIYKIGRVKTIENELTDLFYMLPMSEYPKYSYDENVLYVEIIGSSEIDYVLAYQAIDYSSGNTQKTKFEPGKIKIDNEMHQIMETTPGAHITIEMLRKCTVYIVKKIISPESFNVIVNPVNHYKIDTKEYLKNGYEKNKRTVKSLAAGSAVAGAASGAAIGASCGLVGYGILAAGLLTGFGFVGLAGLAVVGYALNSCSYEKKFEKDKHNIDEINQYMNRGEYQKAANLLDEKLFQRKGGYSSVIKNVENPEEKIVYYLIATYFRGYCHQMEKSFGQAFHFYKIAYEEGIKNKLQATTDIPLFAGLQILKLMCDKTINFDFNLYREIIETVIGKEKLKAFYRLIAEEISGEMKNINENEMHSDFIKEEHLKKSILMQTDIQFLLKEQKGILGEFLECYTFFMQGLILLQYSFILFIKNPGDKNFGKYFEQSSLKFETCLPLIYSFKVKYKYYKCQKPVEEKIKKSADLMEHVVLFCVDFFWDLKLRKKSFCPSAFPHLNNDKINSGSGVKKNIEFSKKLFGFSEKFMLDFLEKNEKNEKKRGPKSVIKVPQFFDIILFSKNYKKEINDFIKSNPQCFFSASKETILHGIVQITTPSDFDYLIPRFQVLADMLKQYRHYMDNKGKTPLFFIPEAGQDVCNFRGILYPETFARKSKKERELAYKLDEKNEVFSQIKDAIENILKNPGSPSRLFLLEGPPGTGKTFAVKNYIEKQLGHIVEEWSRGEKNDMYVKQLTARIETFFQQMISKSKMLPGKKMLFIFIDEIDSVLPFLSGDPQRSGYDPQEPIALFQTKIDKLSNEKNIILIGATNFIERLAEPIISRAGKNIFHFYLPNKKERFDFLKASLEGYYIEGDENTLQSISEITVGYSIRDLSNFVEAIINSQKGIITHSTIKEETQLISFNMEQKFHAKFIFAELNMPKYGTKVPLEGSRYIPEWEAQKKRLQYLNAKKGEGFHVLLHGVPGGGKTSAVRDFASYCNKVLIVMNSSECTQLTVNDFQKVFEFAMKYHDGALIFIDEIDRICVNGSLTGVLQIQMDGFKKNKLTVIGATNYVGFIRENNQPLFDRFHKIEFPKLNIHSKIYLFRKMFMKKINEYSEIKFCIENELSYLLGMQQPQSKTEEEKENLCFTLSRQKERLAIALNGEKDEKSAEQKLALSSRDIDRRINHWMTDLKLFKKKIKHSSGCVYLRFQEVLWMFMSKRLEDLFKRWYEMDAKQEYEVYEAYMEAHKNDLFLTKQPHNSLCLEKVYKIR